MANSFLTISLVTYEALRVLYNELTFTRHINRQYDDKFGVAGAKVGATINARKPPRYTVRDAQAVSIQAMVEQPVPVTLNHQLGVDLEASTADYALSIDNFSDRFLKPAAIAIANKIDDLGMSEMTPLVWQNVGTPGTAPTTLDGYLAAKTRLDNSAAPNGGQRKIVVSPAMEQSIVNGLTTVFNPTKEISQQYIEGSMGKAAGFDWYMDQNVYTQTVGTIANAAVTVNGPNQGANGSIITASWTAADFLNIGDIVGFDGCFAVNPQNRRSTGQLAEFTVSALATADGAGAMTITFTPAMVVGGQFANVSAFPTDAGSVYVYQSATTSTYSAKSSPQGLAFHPDFCTLACADLPVYEKGVVEGFRVPAPELGLSLRVIKAYNVMTDQLVTRLDILMGWSLLYGELCCRVNG